MKNINTQLEEYQFWRNTNKYTTFRYDIINAFIKKYNYSQWWNNILVHYFICTTAASESFWFGFEGESHSKNIAHGLPQRFIAFK